MRIFLKTLILILLLAGPGIANAQKMDRQWVDDLNLRFPGIGDEFQQAVQQKLSQHEETTTVDALIDKLLASSHYSPDKISNPQSFSLHSELMLLHPAIGNYQESLQEAKLLRDFVLKYSAEDERVVQTFRGVYGELLIINGEYGAALQEIEAAINMNPNEEGNYLSRGVAHVKLGLLADALEDLKILVQKPEAEKYAQQLFGFVMANREVFQEAQVQKNTMIDVMLRDMEPPSGGRRVRIPANLENEQRPETSEASLPQQASEEIEVVSRQQEPEIAATPPAKTPLENSTAAEQISAPQSAEATDSSATELPTLERLVTLTPTEIEQALGAPFIEGESDRTIDRDYSYQEQTITIAFDKTSQRIVSVQMFFLPPVDEATAREQLGLKQLDIPPTIDSGMLKVWSPYGHFSKVRFSLSEGQIIAVIIEP